MSPTLPLHLSIEAKRKEEGLRASGMNFLRMSLIQLLLDPDT
jgi:hypothetical protein